jgi:hypothetical protein
MEKQGSFPDEGDKLNQIVPSNKLVRSTQFDVPQHLSGSFNYNESCSKDYDSELDGKSYEEETKTQDESVGQPSEETKIDDSEIEDFELEKDPKISKVIKNVQEIQEEKMRNIGK